MSNFGRFQPLVLCLVFVFQTEAKAGEFRNEPPIISEFKKHPLAFSLIGVGAVVSFLGFSGLFSGGTNSGFHCDKEKNRRSGESEEDCRERINESNEKFYRNMYGVLGSGLVLSGTGAGLLLWENRNQSMASFRILDNKPVLQFAMVLP